MTDHTNTNGEGFVTTAGGVVFEGDEITYKDGVYEVLEVGENKFAPAYVSLKITNADVPPRWVSVLKG